MAVNPYKYNITYINNESRFLVKVYYNGKLIDNLNYDNTYTLSEVDKDVKYKTEKIGFTDYSTGNLIPPFDPQSISLTEESNQSNFQNTLSSTNQTPASPSNSKGEITLEVSSSNDTTSLNPYLYKIETDFGYSTANATPKGWKVYVSYNGFLINFLPDGPLLLDLSRTYDQVVEFIEYKIKKTGFYDSENVFYPPFNPPIPTAIITAPGFASLEKPLIKGDGTVKEDLGVIQLVPIETATELDKIEASQLSTIQLEKLSSPKLTPEYFAQKKLTDLVINLKQTALPLAITLISSFGITQVSQLIEKGKNKASDLKDKISCPSPAEITQLINRKNKLVKQINNSLKAIDKATQIIGITGNVLTTLEISFRILKNLPIPSAVPPGVGLPVNVILGIQDSKDTIDKTITRLKIANTGLLTVLVIVRDILTQLLQHLSLLDSLIQECSPNNIESQEVISNELLSLSQQQTDQNSPVVINVNGFKMGIETENTQEPLKRKRAIAQNKSGVVMLKGEWSFSSIDQILIDELVFYIQINNLKAD